VVEHVIWGHANRKNTIKYKIMTILRNRIIRSYYKICILALLTTMSASVFAQNTTSLIEKTSIASKSTFELAEVFSDYTGVLMSPSDMGALQSSAAKLDSLDYSINFVCSYNVLSLNSTNTLLLETLNASNADSYFFVSVGASNTLDNEISFSLFFKDNETEDIQSTVQLLEILMKQKFIELGKDIKRIPDVMSLAIEEYLKTLIFHLPCKAIGHEGKGYGYYLTPHNVFLKLTAGTNLNVFGSVEDEGTEVLPGRLSHIQVGGDVYSYSFATNVGIGATTVHTFRGYYTDPSDEETIYRFGDDAVQIDKYFTVIKARNASGHCSCIFWERAVSPQMMAVSKSTSTGVNNVEELNNFLPIPVIPTSSNDWIAGRRFANYLINPSICGEPALDENSNFSHVGAIPVNSVSAVKNQIFQAITREGVEDFCYFLFNGLEQELTLYRPGSSPLTINGVSADNIESTISSIGSSCPYSIRFDWDGASANVYMDLPDDYLSVGESYYDKPGRLPFTSNDARAAIEEVIKEKIESLDNINQKASEAGRIDGKIPEDGDIISKDAWLPSYIQFATQELGHLVRNVELNENLWNDENQELYNGKIVNVPGPVAGVADKTLEKARDMKDMIGMAGEFIDDPMGKVSEVYEGVSSLKPEDVVSMISSTVTDQYEDVTSGGKKGQYIATGLVAEIVITIYTLDGGSLILDFTKNITEKAGNLKEFIPNLHDADLRRAYKDVLPDFDKEAFYNDFGENIGTDFFDNWEPNDIDSWGKVKEAAREANPNGLDPGKILRKDMPTLKALSKIDGDLINLVGEGRFNDFLSKLIKANPKCSTCGNLGEELVGNLDKVLGDFHKVLTERIIKSDGTLVDGFDNFIKEAGEQASKAKGASLTLRKLADDWEGISEGGWSISRFEGSIPDIETGHKLDVLLERVDASGVSRFKSLEMKNWRAPRSITGDTYQQFKAYITGGNDFDYHFSNVTDMQENMKRMFQNVFKDSGKASELFDSNPDFFRNKFPGVNSADDLIDLANADLLRNQIDWVK
jgi:hypothetical protein